MANLSFENWDDLSPAQRQYLTENQSDVRYQAHLKRNRSREHSSSQSISSESPASVRSIELQKKNNQKLVGEAEKRRNAWIGLTAGAIVAIGSLIVGMQLHSHQLLPQVAFVLIAIGVIGIIIIPFLIGLVHIITLPKD